LTRAGLRAGSPLRLLVADTAGERAAAGVLRDRLTAAGLDIDLRAVPAQQYSASTAAGGWDLTLLLLRPDYLGSRAVLTPLLDPRWPGLDAVGTLRRSPAWLTEMAAALGEESASRSVARQTGLATTITRDGAVMGLATVATVRTAGPNVGHSPALALLGNVDPANVALGVTRPGESPTSAPSSS
jgi:peptide/nickel transport system substrate-binding protein